MYNEAETVYAFEAGHRINVGRAVDPVFDLACLHDLQGIRTAVALTYPLPPSLAEWVHRSVASVAGSKTGDDAFRGLLRAVRRTLAYAGWPHRYQPEVIAAEPGRLTIPAEDDLRAVARVLAGRNLFLSEIGQALRDNGLVIARPPLECLSVLRLRGLVAVRPAVKRESPGRVSCGRCGNRFSPPRLPCPVCGDPACVACPECAGLGEARGCRSLYRLVSQYEPQAPESGVSVPATAGWPSSSVRLTAAQRDAARGLIAFLDDPWGAGHCLLRAACGAGKTEVVLVAVRHALNRGQRVVVAAPRREVIRELAARLEATEAPDGPAVVLGGHEGRFRQRLLTIATIQQLIRFRCAFDLAVIDEGDAYPLRENPLLQETVKRSVTPSGKMVWLSATPRDQLLTLAGPRIIDIPARPHGFPLPYPEVILSTDLAQGLSSNLGEFLAEALRDAAARVLVFVPTVALTEPTSGEVARFLTGLSRVPGMSGVPGVRCDHTHAKDPDRDRKIDAFRQGLHRVLVATSVLERGVTVPHLQVMVLQADHPIFDWASLVQMAGRAGRSAQYPRDRVVFVARAVSSEMRRALEYIRQLNSGALAKGYITE